MNYRTNRKYLSDDEIMKKYLEVANKDSNLPTAAIVSGNGKTSGSNSLDRYNPFVSVQNPTPTIDIKRP